VLRSEIYIQCPHFPSVVKANMLIGHNVLYFLNVRFRANSDSHFSYYGHVLLHFKVSFSLVIAYLLMTMTNMPIPKSNEESNLIKV